MRRLLVSLLVSSSVVGLAGVAQAAFESRGTTPVTAQVVFASSGVVTVSAVLKKTADNSGASEIGWDAASIIVGTTKWKASNTYIELTSNITAATGGIQIYTDNKKSGASPKYTGSAINPSGLVCVASTGTVLPMCWRVVDVSTNSLTINQGVSGYPNRLYASETGSGYPCFIWMKDKSAADDPSTTGTNETFVNGDDYMVVKDSARGIQHAEATFGSAGSPDYIYLGADFTGILVPNTFKTTIYLETFSE